MGGHPFRRRPGFVQQARDRQVARGALAGQQVLVDGDLHDRVDEAKDLVMGEHDGSDEEIGHRSGLSRIDSGRSCRKADVGLSAEHGHRASERGCGGAKALKAA